MKRALSMMVVLACAAWGAGALAVAKEPDDALKMKLEQVRQEREGVIDGYQQEIHGIKKAADDKVAQFKAEFHKARNECLADADKKCADARAAYEAKIKPLNDEEKGLIEALGPGSGMNFAKSKKERT